MTFNWSDLVDFRKHGVSKGIDFAICMLVAFLIGTAGRTGSISA